MPADTCIESLEPIQSDVKMDVDTSSAVPSPQPKSLPEKVLCFRYHSSHCQDIYPETSITVAITKSMI